jgi:uncharacterized protein (DUF697 family)
MDNIENIKQMSEKAQKCVNTHAGQAIAVSFIPLVSVPIVYGVCAKMIVQLDKIFGIPTAKGWDSEILNDIIAGIIAAPALAIPILGAGVASSYIKSIGESYAQAVAAVVSTSAPEELSDGTFVADRVKEELQKIYAKQREKRRERMKDRKIIAEG